MSHKVNSAENSKEISNKNIWVMNPITKRPIKKNSRLYNSLVKLNMIEKKYINPCYFPPNNNVDSEEYKAWIFKMVDYYNKKKNKTIKIINLSK